MRVLIIALGLTRLTPVLAQSDRDDESAILVEEAREAIEHEDAAEAAAHLRQAIQLNPRRIDAYVLLAGALVMTEQYPQGLEVLRRAQGLAPGNLDVMTSLGSVLMLLDRGEEARPVLEEVVRRDPDRYQAHAALGAHYLARQRWSDAAFAYEAYLRSRPQKLARDDSTHQLALARAYLRDHRPTEALARFRRLRSADPSNQLAHLGVVWALATIDCRQALAEIQPISGWRTTFPEHGLVEARCALATRDRKRALELAQHYVKVRPRDPIGWTALAEAHERGHALDAAARAYARAAALLPGSCSPVLALARVDRLRDRPAQALERLDTPCSEDPSAEWELERARNLAATDRASEIVTMWQRADTTAWRGEQHALLGLALHRSGDVEAAAPHLERALHLGYRSPDVTAILSQRLHDRAREAIQQDRWSDAEIDLERASEFAASPSLDFDLVRVYLHNQRYAKALPLARRLAEQDGRADSQILYARALEGQGDRQRAIEVLSAKLDAGSPADRVDRAIEVAALQLLAGDPHSATASMTAILRLEVDSERAQARERASWIAARAQATQLMSQGAYLRAYRTLKAIEKRTRETLADDSNRQVDLSCDIALAATGAGKRDEALERLRQLHRSRATCSFVAPADRLAVPILLAWNEGLASASANSSLTKLRGYRRRASGAARALVEIAMRDVAYRAAEQAYRAGKLRIARSFLAKVDDASPEREHNLAVIDLQEGRVDRAITALSEIAAELPFAHVNLGIAQHRLARWLDAEHSWRRALAAGVVHPPLRKWLETKNRMWGTRQ